MGEQVDDAANGEHVANGVGHFDIAGPDVERLSGFYRSVFGWGIVSQGAGYALVDTPDDSPGGAIVEAEEAALIMGVVVPDLDAVLATAVANGGGIGLGDADHCWVRSGLVVDQ